MKRELWADVLDQDGATLDGQLHQWTIRSGRHGAMKCHEITKCVSGHDNNVTGQGQEVRGFLQTGTSRSLGFSGSEFYYPTISAKTIGSELFRFSQGILSQPLSFGLPVAAEEIILKTKTNQLTICFGRDRN